MQTLYNFSKNRKINTYYNEGNTQKYFIGGLKL